MINITKDKNDLYKKSFKILKIQKQKIEIPLKFVN